MVFILYNPYSNNKKGDELIKEIEQIYAERKHKVISLFDIRDIRHFCEHLEVVDSLVLCGGDGTLNHFVNDIYPLKIKQPILYYPGGSGNDFCRDVKDSVEFEKSHMIPLNDYIDHLPEVYVEGKKYYFINGVGFGIDGYVCEKGDEFRKKSEKPVNYTKIALGGLLGGFHPCDAKVTIDGVTREFKHVWLAPTMLGRYYGGGMKIAPAQDRLNSEHEVTTVIWHTKTALRTLLNFTKIFTGDHIKKKKMAEVFKGHLVTVEFSKPQSLQIDGETITRVKKYTVSYD